MTTTVDASAFGADVTQASNAIPQSVVSHPRDDERADACARVVCGPGVQGSVLHSDHSELLGKSAGSQARLVGCVGSSMTTHLMRRGGT